MFGFLVQSRTPEFDPDFKNVRISNPNRPKIVFFILEIGTGADFRTEFRAKKPDLTNKNSTSKSVLNKLDQKSVPWSMDRTAPMESTLTKT